MPDNKHREGSLDAPTRYPIDWKSEKFNDPDDLTKELVCETKFIKDGNNFFILVYMSII